MTQLIKYEREGATAIITLDNAKKMNPLSLVVQQELCEQLARLRDDSNVRAVVLTANGEAFCAGADLSEQMLAAPSGAGLGDRVANTMHSLTNRLISDMRALPVPIVAAVNGVAAGAGVGLALAADVVLAARSAYFYLPFIAKLGIIPDLGTTWFYERLLGRARATALTLLGDRLPAERAEQWGLIWACVDDGELRAEALAMAHRLGRLPAHAALETRNAYDAAGRNGLEEQLQYEAERQRHLVDRPEFGEGLRAFLEKREPRFAPR